MDKLNLNTQASRSFLITRSDDLATSRTVPIAFASEELVLRTDSKDRAFYEKLIVTEDAIDLSRMQNNAPFLIEHDREDQVGAVISARVDSDKIARCQVKVSRSQKGQEILDDINDEIRTQVSVGYTILEYQQNGQAADGIPIIEVTRWQPYEVSTVSIAADYKTIGVKRSEDAKEMDVDLESEAERAKMKSEVTIEHMSYQKITEEITIEEDAGAETEVEESGDAREMTGEIDATRSNTKKTQIAVPRNEEIKMTTATNETDLVAQRNKEISEILAIGMRKGIMTDAQTAIAAGKSLDEFRAIALDKETAQPVKVEIGLDAKEVRKFSLTRAIDAAHTGDWRGAEFEREVTEATEKKSGKASRGIMLPSDILERSMNVATPTAGGNSVATDMLAGNYIDFLSNKVLISGLGATVLSDLRGDVTIPKKLSEGTGYWVDEEEDAGNSEFTIGQIAMTPKTVAGYTEISRKLMQQSSLSVDTLVMQDLMSALARTIDKATLFGTGTGNQPKGIANQTGINLLAAGTNGGAITWELIVAMETAIAEANADIGSLAYVTNAAQRGKLKTTLKAANEGFLWEAGNLVNGYKTAITNQVPKNFTKGTGTDLSAMIFGNFSDLLIAYWGVVDLMIDKSQKAKSGGVLVTAFQDVDFAVRNAASFSVIKDLV